MPPTADVVVPTAHAAVQRWQARILFPFLTLAGAATVKALWGLAPWYVYTLGVATAALGVWLQVIVEMSTREALTVGGDGSIRIHSPALLARDVCLDPQDVVSITFAEPASNRPPGDTLFSLFGRGGYLRIEMRDPQVLAGVRWTNWLWCLRAASDPNYIAAPLPRTETAVVAFYASATTADAAIELFSAAASPGPA